jgi:FixJ family two-component response regulator
MQSQTVHLIDEQDSFSASLIELISSMRLRVITFSSGGDFLKALDADCSGCVIVDLGKPHLDGMRVINELARIPLSPPVIVLTGEADVSTVVLAAHRGVLAYLQKQQTSRTEILEAIQLALSGREILVIADVLKVSRRTVDSRRTQLMKKLKVKTFTDLVALETEHRNLPPAR